MKLKTDFSLGFCLCLTFAGSTFAGSVTVSPTSLSFGNQVVGIPSAVKQITLTNGSAKALTITSITNSLADYTQTNNCPISPSTLAIGASCIISVTFTPTTLGTRSDTLHVNDNASNSPQNVSLSGSGVTAVTVTPTSLSFSNQTVGTKSSSQNVTVKNNKTTSITITSIASNLSDYTTTTTCPVSPSTLAGGGTCAISVFFTPAVTGTRTATLTVSTNAGVNPTVSLTGTGTVAVAVTPSALTFAGQALGTTSAAQLVTLTNNQSKALKITSITSSLTDFARTTTCPLSPSTLAAGASCTASVTFSPTATGNRTGTLSFNDNATNTPQTVSLTGTGNAATLVSIAVTPANPFVAAGLTQQFTATGTYTDGSTQNLTSTVTWTSSAAAVAVISTTGLATAKAQGTATITAVSGSVSASTTFTVTPAILVSIAVTPANPSFAKGTTQQLTATGTYSDGSTLDITASVLWSTAAASIATISSSGLATSGAVGSTTATATSGSTSGSTNLTVTAATLVSIAVTPDIPTVPLGLKQQFTATGTYTDGSTQDITTSVTWSSLQAGVASISNSAGSQGLATSVATGPTTISATMGAVSGGTTLTVGAAALASIAVSPGAPSIALGTSQQFAATGTFSDGSTQDITATVNWSSDAAAIATIASTGLATSTGMGSTTITATAGTLRGSAVLTVSAAQLVSITVAPLAGTVPAGTTQQFTATGTFSDGSTQDISTTGHWSSSDASVATISNTPGSQGLASTFTSGSTTVTINSGLINASATLNVTAAALLSIAITPQAPAIVAGASQQFTASGTYTDQTVQDITGVVTWSSSNAGVAIISNAAGSNGLATSAGPGTATVSATLGSISASTTLTVNAPVAVALNVTPASVAIQIGGSQQFTATATFSDNTSRDVTSVTSWSSSVPGVASVDGAGDATGVGAGAATISATYAGLTASSSLSVTAPVLVSVTLSPVDPALVLGTSQQLSATGTYSNGGTSDVTGLVQWSSAIPGVATVDAQGKATTVAAGSTAISATLGSISGSTSVTVTPATLVSIAVTPANPSFAKGTTQQLTATGTYSDGSTLDITASVLWSTAAASIATISSSGLATSGAVGSTTATATSGSTSGSTNLTVTAATLVSIAVTPDIPTVPLGLNQQFTATGTYTDGSTQDITTSVTWSSSQAGVASISNSAGSQGLATSVATGPATISATMGAVSGSTTLTVGAAALASIAVSPGAPSIALGTSQQFTATGTFSDGSTQDITATVNWSSDAAAIATIASTGLATSTGIGSTTITATAGTLRSSAVLTVSAAQLVSITVAPLAGTVPAGTTQQFTATGTFSDGSTQDISTTGHWSSSDASVATISNTPGSQGLASTFTPGSTTVTINSGLINASATLNVTAAALVSIAMTPQAPAIVAGASQQFTATGTYTDNTVQDITGVVTWSSSNAGVAIISNAAGSNGLATSAGAGTATITAALGSISASTTLTITGAVPVSLSITPSTASIQIGASQQFALTATLSDASTQDVTGLASWSSSMPGVATVDGSGDATGVGAGAATITATYAGLTASASLSVTAPVLVSVTVAPVNPTLALGTSLQLSATGTYSNGSTSDVTGLAQWSSASPGIATVDAQGKVTAVAAGSTVITATLGSVSGTTTVKVTAGSIINAFTAAASTINGGDSTTLSWSVTGAANIYIYPSVGVVPSSGTAAVMPSRTTTYTLEADSAAGNAYQALTITVNNAVNNAIQPSFFAMSGTSGEKPPLSIGFVGHPFLVWGFVERTRGSYSWNAVDIYVNWARDKGYTDEQGNVLISLTLGKTPSWAVASQSSCTTANGVTTCSAPPDNIQDWTDFVAAMVNHYNGTNAPRVKYYELWNEANSSGFYSGTKAQLMALAQAAYPIIHGAASYLLGPSVSGPMGSSLSGDGGAYLSQYYQLGAWQYADGAATHGYLLGSPTVTPFPWPEDTNTGTCTRLTTCYTSVDSRMKTLRNILDTNGMAGKPIFNAEGSWGNASLTDIDQQIAWLARWIILQAGVSSSTNLVTQNWYTWGGGTAQTWGTIETAAHTPTAAGLAYNQVYNWLVGASVSPCSANGNIWTCAVTRNGYTQQLIWDKSQSCSGGSCTTSTQAVSNEYTTFQDSSGSTSTIVNGTIAVSIKPLLLSGPR